MSYKYNAPIVVKPSVSCDVCTIGIGKTLLGEEWFHHMNTTQHKKTVKDTEFTLCDGCNESFITRKSFRTKLRLLAAKKIKNTFKTLV